MRFVLIFISLFLFKNTIGQDQSTRHYFKEIGWTIDLPVEFKVLDSTQSSAIINNGKKEIEQTLDVKVNVLETIQLLSAKKSFNYFNATLTNINPEKEKKGPGFVASQEAMVYKAMSQQAKVDSSSTTITIGELSFRKYEMTVHVNEKSSFYMTVVSRIFKAYYFVIVYVYLDDATKYQLETMLTTSTFSD